jgi:phenylpropionate dioxygenase-like ring-hydroxylating dioxygenase large terminal subunit
MENVRDSYHASLLHFMMATFNYNRQTATGGIDFSDDALHHCSWSADATDKDQSSVYSKNLRAVRAGFQLKDPSVMDYFDEYPCGTTAAIQSLFPTCVVQQIRNVIGCRLVVPKTVDSCELHWWLLGTEDDTPEQEAMRIKQSNLVGPAGLVSMEDGVVIGWVQRATRGDPHESSVLQMGGRDISQAPNSRVTEVSVRSFWRAYRGLMGQ